VTYHISKHFSDPTLNAVYQAWQRHRDTNPQGALRVVEAYAEAHRLSVRDLLRRFAEAEAWEASQTPEAAPEALGGPSGEGG
jgi:ABC-type nitrate/sulfonate/bicarbonate transport system substrate-binding protein